MDVGSLRHLVTLQSPTKTFDTDGGYTEAWAPLSPSQVWASIKPATARDLERAVAGTVQAAASHLVAMRYHSGVTTKTRIIWGTRILAVQGVQNVDERNAELVLACEEVAA